jgi:hypothetical protein
MIMRTLVLAALCLPATLAAFQSQTTTIIRDINGHPVDWTQSRSGDGRSVETVQTVNGRRAPLEQVQEKILKNEGGVRVIERLLTRYSQDGRPLPPEKTVIETTTRPDGSSTETTTVWRGDLNGQLRPAQRLVTESAKSGDTVNSQTTVERASINGGFDLAERRSARETTTKFSSERDEIIYTRDANGQFIPSNRTVIRSRTSGNQTETRIDEYEAVTTGSLKLARQSVARKVKDPAGFEREEIDVFGPAAPGRPIPDDGSLRLRERQVYTSRQSPDGSVVQVFAIQRPSLSSSKDLGPLQTISETVCKGKCN